MMKMSASASIRMAGESGISWPWLLAVGALITLLGVVGLAATYWLTIAAVFWCGILAVIAGIAQIVDAFHHKGWKGTIWHVLIGLIYIAAGSGMIVMPRLAALWLTVFLAVSLIFVGLLRIVMAFQLRKQGLLWGIVLLAGVLSIALGVMINGAVRPPSPDALSTSEGQAAWVRSWGWIIGLLVAIEMISEGLTLVALALAVKSKASERPAEAMTSL